MLCRPWRQIGAVALVLGLAACAALEARQEQQDGVTLLTSPYDQQDMSLRFASGPDATKKGKRPDKVPGTAFDRGRAITDILDNLEAPPSGNLGKRIDDLIERPEKSPKMNGLGSIQARGLLEVASLTLNSQGKYAGPLNGKKVDVVGKIENFYFKPNESMHVTVQIITTASRGSKTYKRAEKYRVEIAAGALTVEERTGPNDNMFPDFASAAFPVAKPPDQDFQWKLWAVGEDVRVTKYWIDATYAGGTPNYTEYTAANAPPHLASIFIPHEEDCFDMMFKLNPADQSPNGALVNGELPPGSKPPYYCLGRCSNPPIVNTR